jgi:hypothetical protein
MLVIPTPESLSPSTRSRLILIQGSRRNNHNRVRRRAETPVPWCLARSSRNMISPGSSQGPWRGVATDPGFGPRCDFDGLWRGRYPAVGRGEEREVLASNAAARLGPEDDPLTVGVRIAGNGPDRGRWRPSLV